MRLTTLSVEELDTISSQTGIHGQLVSAVVLPWINLAQMKTFVGHGVEMYRMTGFAEQEA